MMQHKVKVLIVDDNERMRKMVKLYLRGLADEIRECEDGEQAFDAYAEFQPDWVVMDLVMERVDGLTATRRIIATFPDAHILMVTQYDDIELRAAAGEAGVSGYVLKENLLDMQRLLQSPLTQTNTPAVQNATAQTVMSSCP
ncbi:MAG: response regulator transcription factor [Pyrinomonadaceae bacterium]